MKPLNILVPTDFSETAENAFTAALWLVRQTGGKITPFHSYIPLNEVDGYFYMGFGVTAQLNNTELDNHLMARLNETADRLIPGEFRGTPVIGTGAAANAISNIAHNYDLVVMGSHGRSGVSRFILGSVTEKVLRMVKTPVLAVKEIVPDGMFRKILLPLDLSLNSLSVISFVRNLLADGDTTVDLLHLVTTDDYNDDKNARIQASLQEDNLKSIVSAHIAEFRSRVNIISVVSQKPPYEEIIERAENGNYDLIAMTRVGKSALSYLTLGSTTANVIRGSQIPVLSVRPPNT